MLKLINSRETLPIMEATNMELIANKISKSAIKTFTISSCLSLQNLVTLRNA